MLPALRSSRLPPLAALRELARPARISPVRSALGFVLIAAGSVPIAALRGVGGLAGQRAGNPRRTAATASALMVGLAVLLVPVIGRR